MNNYDVKCKILEEELRTFWPKWHVMKRLGGGAFGDVFEVYRDNFGIRESSALKMIQISDAEETEALFLSVQEEAEFRKQDGQTVIPETFRNEILTMEALRGAPNIVIIEDFHLKRDASSTILFVRMELLTSFQKIMAERRRSHSPFTIPEVLKIGRDICTALMFCEEKGIIHRDIKPANLFIDGFGNYKIGDFGASKRLDTVHAAKTMTGIGTISYMAPEIFRGRSYNNTVDIYAVGLVLYQLLNNGRMPFLPTEGPYTTKDIDSANYQRLHGMPLPSLSGKTVGGNRIDSRLDAAVRKACAMEPADRYQTAKEFYEALTFQETAEKKNTSEYVKRPQGSLAPAGSLQSRQQEMEHSGHTVPEAVAPVTPPVDRPVNSPPQKEKRNPLLKKPALIICLLLIAAMISLAVLKSRGGPSASSEADSAAQTEDEKEKGLADVDRVPGPISDSWEEIIASGKDGTYIDKYQIGDTKELDLGKEGVIEMELVAFDADELEDGSGKAPMTWIAKDLLNSEHAINKEHTYKGGWSASEMRGWLRESVLPLFPESLRSNIREVKKWSYSSDDNSTISSGDTIWIPSRREIFGRELSFEEEGLEYSSFMYDASRLKYHLGASSASWWWLRSAYSRISFYGVYSGGNYGIYNAAIEGGVVVGFCL